MKKILAVLAGMFLASCDALQDNGGSIPYENVKSAQESAVYLTIYYGEERAGHCSGTVVATDKVLSAGHCILDIDSERVNYKVRLWSGKVIDAEPVKSGDHIEDASQDWAVFELEEPVDQERVAPIADDIPRVGEQVYTVANPGSTDWTFHVGYWSKTRYMGNPDGSIPEKWQHAYTVQIPTSSGASGSGIYNRAGELVAVLSGVYPYNVPNPFGGRIGSGGATLVTPVPDFLG